jgi:hypothetical protein
LDIAGKRQNTTFLTGRISGVQKGKFVTKDKGDGIVAVEDFNNCESQEENRSVGVRQVDQEGVLGSRMETCLVGVGVELTVGPQACDVALNESQTRFCDIDPSPGFLKTRTVSVSQNRSTGPVVKVGRMQNDGLDFSDSISLVEYRPGVISKQDDGTLVSQDNNSKDTMRRGRSRKPREKSKLPRHPNVLKPKFMQLGDVMKEGTIRMRKKKKDDGMKTYGGKEASSEAVSDSNGVEVGGLLSLIRRQDCNWRLSYRRSTFAIILDLEVCSLRRWKMKFNRATVMFKRKGYNKKTILFQKLLNFLKFNKLLGFVTKNLMVKLLLLW